MDILTSVQHTLLQESEAIRRLWGNTDGAAVQKAIDVLAACRGKIITSGCGTSGAAGRKLAHTFSCVECPALFLEPSDAVHGGLGVVQKEDVVILLSKGGSTSEINHLIKPCKQKGAFVIGVTENAASQLATQSDLFLPVRVDSEPDPFNMLATSSILAVIALFDAICIALMQIKGYTREQFGLIHPGGAVGERLLNQKLYQEEA